VSVDGRKEIGRAHAPLHDLFAAAIQAQQVAQEREITARRNLYTAHLTEAIQA
jgi:hypothetical protein